MDFSWMGISHAVHQLEEIQIPMPSSKAVLVGTAVGIPLAVLLHETADSWMPVRTNIPVLSWFMRKWRSDARAKPTHLRIFRNLAIFAWFTAVLYESDVRMAPIEYVSDRVTSSNARRTMTDEIRKSRATAFASANEVIGETAFDVAKSSQQRDAALRRRNAHESRLH